MAIELPRFEIPRINTDDLTSHVELPRLDTSKVELPKVDLPKVDIPRFDLPAIGRRIDGVGRDLRALRIVREPSPAEARARAASTAGIWLLGGLGIGMALMYFFDPRLGRIRRQRLADRLGDLTGMAQRAMSRPEDEMGEARDTDFELDRPAMADTMGSLGVSDAGTGFGGETGMGTGIGTAGGTDTIGAADSDTDEDRASRMAELATTQGS
jgi:hypothetical protein